MTLPRAKRRAARPAQIARAVDEGRESLDLYLDEISRVPLLSRDEEMELARKAFRGNIIAQEKLARHNVRFVVSVAKKFQNRGVPLVDALTLNLERPSHVALIGGPAIDGRNGSGTSSMRSAVPPS